MQPAGAVERLLLVLLRARGAGVFDGRHGWEAREGGEEETERAEGGGKESGREGERQEGVCRWKWYSGRGMEGTGGQ